MKIGDEVIYCCEDVFNGNKTEERCGKLYSYRGGHDLCEIVDRETSIHWVVKVKDVSLPVEVRPGNPNYEYKVVTGFLAPK